VATDGPILQGILDKAGSCERDFTSGLTLPQKHCLLVFVGIASLPRRMSLRFVGSLRNPKEEP
jgi:hypothetical protein